MLMKFSKMHGLGNDFIVIDAVTQSVRISRAMVKRIADRHTGVGCDQVLVLEPPMIIMWISTIEYSIKTVLKLSNVVTARVASLDLLEIKNYPANQKSMLKP